MADIAILEHGADTAGLAAVHATCFARSWDATVLANLLAGAGAFAFYHAQGFVLARAVAGEAEILTLAVAPTARGRGIGRALMKAAVAHAALMGARAVFLEVGADNPAALSLYAGLGFVAVGTRKGYYAGKDAAVLRLSLSADFA